MTWYEYRLVSFLITGWSKGTSTVSSILCYYFEGSHDIFEKEREEGQEKGCRCW